MYYVLYTLLKAASYYDLSVPSMSVMGFKKNPVWGGWVGVVSSIQFFWNFCNFAKPLTLSPFILCAVTVSMVFIGVNIRHTHPRTTGETGGSLHWTSPRHRHEGWKVSHPCVCPRESPGAAAHFGYDRLICGCVTIMQISIFSSLSVVR